MPLPRFEVPAGAIDGVNTLFVVSQPYRPGSVAVFLNGQLIRQIDDDGWSETSPALGQVTLTEAPILEDVVQIFYIDTSPALPGEEISQISGRITDGEDNLRAVWAEVESLSGLTQEAAEIAGLVSEYEPLLAQAREVEEIRGVLEVVCQ
jgi:hypothetical protein